MYKMPKKKNGNKNNKWKSTDDHLKKLNKDNIKDFLLKFFNMMPMIIEDDNHNKLLKTLIKIDTQSPKLFTQEKKDNLLLIAANAHSHKNLKTLIAAGANINAVDEHGNNALHYAMTYLSAFYYPQTKDCDNISNYQTSLMQITEILSKFKIKSILNKDGYNPILLASLHQSVDVLEVFKDYLLKVGYTSEEIAKEFQILNNFIKNNIKPINAQSVTFITSRGLCFQETIAPKIGDLDWLAPGVHKLFLKSKNLIQGLIKYDVDLLSKGIDDIQNKILQYSTSNHSQELEINKNIQQYLILHLNYFQNFFNDNHPQVQNIENFLIKNIDLATKIIHAIYIPLFEKLFLSLETYPENLLKLQKIAKSVHSTTSIELKYTHIYSQFIKLFFDDKISLKQFSEVSKKFFCNIDNNDLALELKNLADYLIEFKNSVQEPVSDKKLSQIEPKIQKNKKLKKVY